ncbi:MAG TPA: SRPBCC domain-containing protein [Kofleriaceae bacterium]|nr:SRPBCC domain-containing protein [Kofleriaceae bacterium]
MQADREVHETLEIDADLAAVWRAWTEPEQLRGWMAERAEGTVAVGERVRLSWDSLGLELDLDVVTCEPERRLVVRGGAAGRPPQTQSVELSRAAGGTRVALAHRGFAPGPAGEAERAGTAAGWHVMLRVLAHYLDGRVTRRRECAAVLAPVAAPLAVVGDLLHRPDGRAAWLVDGDSPALSEGTRFALRGPGGASMTGRVLAVAPPFELALTWDQIDGVVVLRAIQIAPGASVDPVLAVAQAWSWSPERPAWPAARATLEAAIARLVRAAGGAPGGAA